MDVTRFDREMRQYLSELPLELQRQVQNSNAQVFSKTELCRLVEKFAKLNRRR